MATPDDVTNHTDVTERFSPSPEEQEASIERPRREAVSTKPDFIRTSGPRDEDD